MTQPLNHLTRYYSSLSHNCHVLIPNPVSRGVILLAYHEPGYPIGHSLVSDLSKEVESIAGIRPLAMTLSNLNPYKGDIVFALLPARGGHYHVIEERCKEKGARLVGPIPPQVSARSIARLAHRCRRLTIIYREARRFRDEQVEDVLEIKSILERAYGFTVNLAPYEYSKALREGCGVVLTLMPSKITEKFNNIIINGLLPGARRDLALWIASSLQRLGVIG